MKIKRFYLLIIRIIKKCVFLIELRDENLLVLVYVNMSLFFCCFVECVFNEIELGRNIMFFLYFNKYFDGVKCVWVL